MKKSDLNLVNALRVAEPILFVFDSEDIQVFDLKTNKEVSLSYDEICKFFQDVQFTKTLDVYENCVSPKVNKTVKAVYDTRYHDIILHVISDCKRYLLHLNISCYNVLVNADQFKQARFLNSELVS